MENRKIKTGVIISIVAAAAIVVAAVAAVILILVLDDPKSRLGKGLVNMAEEMKVYTTRIFDDIDFKALAEAGKSQPVHTKVNVSITNPDPAGSPGNVNLGFDSVSDVKNKLGKVDVKAGAYGFDLDIGSIIADSNTFYIVSDLFFQGDVYSVGLENFGEDFNNSIWAKYTNIKIPEDTSFTLFEEGKYDEAAVHNEELANIFKKCMTEMASAVKYDKIKEKKEFAEAGSMVRYGGVQLTVDKDAYNTSMANLKNDILASGLYVQCVDRYKKINPDDAGSYKEKLDKAIEAFTGVKAGGDIVLNFYIDKKGRVRNLSTPENIPVSFNDSKISSVSVSLDFTGTERRLDSVEGGICFYSEADGQVLEMGITRTASVAEDSYNEDLTLRFGSATEGDAIFSYINSWTYADRSYDMKIMADYNDRAMRLSARGGYEDVEKGNGFTLRVDSVTLNVDTKDVLIASGKISTGMLEGSEIEVPQNATDVLKMSEMDVMAAAMKAAAAFEKFKKFQ